MGRNNQSAKNGDEEKVFGDDAVCEDVGGDNANGKIVAYRDNGGVYDGKGKNVAETRRTERTRRATICAGGTRLFTMRAVTMKS